MTRDDNGQTGEMGEPSPVALEPADVIRCRECNGLVRRVNEQHLNTIRCEYGSVEARRSDQPRPDHPSTVTEYKSKHPDAPVMSPREKAKLAEMNSDPEVDRRRKDIMRRRWNGDPMTRIVEDVARRYDVTVNTVWSDWKIRHKWMPRVYGFEDAEGRITEALARQEDVRDRLIQIANRARDQNELGHAVSALKAVEKSLGDTIDTTMDLHGIGEAQKQEISVSGKFEVEHKPEPGTDLPEEKLRAIDSITGGGDEEIIDVEFEEVKEEQ